MNVATSPAWAPASARRSGSSSGLPLVFVGGALTTAVAGLIGDSTLIAAVAPLLFAAGLCVMWVIPMRNALFALVFLGLALDVPAEGPWSSPLAPVGRLLAQNLDKTTVVPLPVTGDFLLLGVLVLIHFVRTLSGSRVDAAGRDQTATPLLGALAVSCLAVFVLWTWGAMRGGDFHMAKMQVQPFLLLLLLAYASRAGFRGLRDYRTLGVLIVAAGCIKSLMALYVTSTRAVLLPDFATSHGDSVLFAFATVILIVRYAEQPVRRNLAWCLMLLPLLIAGMQANDRRLVWFEVAAALVMFWMVSRRTRAKRMFARGLVLLLPFFVAYVAIGWNSKASMFAPIQAYRSASGSDPDSSTLYRDTENYNLLMTMRLNPLLGTGFGQPFIEFVKLPDISFFREYPYAPHNSILGLWVFTGAVGFTGISLAAVVAGFLARRSYLHARTPEERVAAFMVLAMIVIYAIQCWGDIGFGERRCAYLLGPALALAGQLAVSTGAWGVRSARTATVAR